MRRVQAVAVETDVSTVWLDQCQMYRHPVACNGMIWIKVSATNHIRIEQVITTRPNQWDTRNLQESRRISTKIQLDIRVLNIEEASVH